MPDKSMSVTVYTLSDTLMNLIFVIFSTIEITSLSMNAPK